MINILIFGYYNRQNWGDDVFEYVFKNYIFSDSSKYNLIFKNLDDLDTNVKQYNKIDKVIIGGGDIINEYFFNEDKIKLFRQYFQSKPVYFVGIGLTYPNLITIMDIGDYFFMRNSTDYKYAKNRYGDQYSFNIPDIAFNLLKETSLVNFTKPIKDRADIQNIGLILPGTWIPENENKKDRMVDKICDLINTLSSDYNIHLIPFDTTIKPNNSDILLIEDIQKEMKRQYPIVNNVHYLIPQKAQNGEDYEVISVNEMIEYFKMLDITICGRFHATILSIITNTPFIAIHSTQKLQNLQTDLSELSHYFIELEKNENGIPIKIDKKRVLDAVKNIRNNYAGVVDKLHRYTEQFGQDTLTFNKQINDLLDSTDTIVQFRQTPPQYITSEDKAQLVKATVSGILTRIFNKISVNDIDSILRGRPIVNILPRTKATNLDSFRKILTEEILWTITGDPYAPYYYGLYENIFKSTFLDQLNWIINDYHENYGYKPSNKSNITIINKNFQRLHRSGWQYIVNNIVMQLNNTDMVNPLIIDTYIDKTFHWNKDFYQSKNIIPYVKPWIGFIHHTYSDYNNNYNCLELFKEQTFIQSLVSCKALIVMTQYLSQQIKQTLRELNLTHINVHTIIHPTENSDIQFTWDNFMNNDNKQVIQIGNWLRDVFGIYRVILPESSLIKEKAILKNRNSESYFPPNNFLNNLYAELNDNGNVPNKTPASIDICRNAFKNMHIKGLYNCIVEMEESVKVIEFLDNDDYDKLLSKNIVFLNLVDASACNTLIECVIRNTPIIVNPIPPVVEILGKDYPLYYKNYYDVSKILESPSKIKEGYDYLCNMPKDALDINTFIKELTDVVNLYTKK